MFDGDGQKYELWEEKFLAYMLLKDLKKTILPLADGTQDETDFNTKNEKAYAELIQFLDDTSLQLVMRDGKDNGRESLKILRTHYKGKGKTRLLSLYAELGTLMKSPNQSLTEYILTGEKIVAAIKSAGETISDVLMISSILHGLPDEYESFRVYIIQSEESTYTKFKEKLRNFEENDRGRNNNLHNESVMKAAGGYNNRNSDNGNNNNGGGQKVVCFSCNTPGHKSKDCNAKKNKLLWCNSCNSNTHSTQSCRSKKNKPRGGGGKNGDNNNNSAKATKDKEHTFHFMVKDDESGNESTDESTDESSDEEEDVSKSFSFTHNNDKVPSEKLLVDTGATAHIINDESKFCSSDPKFKPDNHFVELADGRKYNNLAIRRGDVPIEIYDVNGNNIRSGLRQALCIPSFPQNVFSVSSATEHGSTVTFRKDKSEVTTKEGNVIPIQKDEKLYFMDNVDFVGSVSAFEAETDNKETDIGPKTKSKVPEKSEGPVETHSREKWPQIISHCNQHDILKQEKVVKGMKIASKTKFQCETCIRGKQVKHFNRFPEEKTERP